MKLFLIRYIKITFLYLRLHIVFNLFTSFFANLLYLTRFSAWAAKNRHIEYNDFPSKWNYEKRYPLYKWVINTENLNEHPINYIEFGVSEGYSFRWFLQEISNSQSRFYGFDTFTGLPEDWGPFKKGTMSTNHPPPVIADNPGKFFQGPFQQTVPGFLSELDASKRNVILLDA